MVCIDVQQHTTGNHYDDPTNHKQLPPWMVTDVSVCCQAFLSCAVVVALSTIDDTAWHYPL